MFCLTTDTKTIKQARLMQGVLVIENEVVLLYFSLLKYIVFFYTSHIPHTHFAPPLTHPITIFSHPILHQTPYTLYLHHTLYTLYLHYLYHIPPYISYSSITTYIPFLTAPISCSHTSTQNFTS